MLIFAVLPPTLGKFFYTSGNNIIYGSCRFFIFPRIKADTAIVSQCVDPACVEFSGQFPCKDKTEWENLNMDKAIKLLATVRLPANDEKILFERLEAAC